MAVVKTALPEEVFQDFFRSYLSDGMGSKYRKRLAQVSVSNGKSLIIDFDDLISFDPALARSIVERPDDYITYASSAATAQMRVEDPEYAEHVGKIFARFRRFPEKTALRKIGAEHIKKLALVDGIVVRTTQVRPTIVSAVFRCRKCLETIVQDQEGELIRGPGTHCPFCKQSTSFELIEEQSKFKNTQEARIQERPEDLPPGQLPRYLTIRLEDALVDSARPGDRVAVTSTVRAEKQTVGERGRLRTFNIYLEANFVDVVGKETEVVEITPEDEKQILEVSQDPWVHRKLIMSLAPSIYGYEDVKEGILYLLFGGTAKQLPDGINIRGDENVLLIGDPGCLIGDERIVLGDGTIAKIQDLGQNHLEEIDVPVLIGSGGAKRDVATRFHVYRNQPTIEIVTESGKSIRGTYNHPLLAVETVNRTLVRRWKRLDEFKIGDKVSVVTGFPCYVRSQVDTGFRPLPYNLGPKFRGRLPENVTPDLGAFLGYLLGDGWVQRYRVGFLVAEGEKDLLEPLCANAEKLFGIKPKVRERKLAGRKVLLYNAVIGSQDVASNLSFLREKPVPTLIVKSGDKVVAQFLKWLYEADGTVFSSRRGCGAIGLKAKNIELLRDVQVPLLRFGIHSRIIENALLTRRGESILKFARKIGFASNKKRIRLANLEARAKRLRRLTGQRSERIVAIYNREPADVYDIEVSRTHRFIANGIVATLNARAAVLAAANPALGRYEPHRNVGENINLPVTILSRFDLIFIIKDQPEADYDARMSEHILALHRSKTSPETAPFAPDFLRKYISFAKRIIPVLSPEAVIELRDFYLKMRSKGGAEAAVAITPRQLEALVRISEARARAFLRDRVTVEDAKSAIRIMTVSLSDVGVDVKTGAMDIDVIMTGKPRSLRDSFQRVIETVAELERETGTVEETVLLAALVDKEKMEEREARRLIGQLIKEGILYSPKPGRLKRTAG